jgi:hypothetical protein
MRKIISFAQLHKNGVNYDWYQTYRGGQLLKFHFVIISIIIIIIIIVAFS